ncbi:potassium-transporting ATPase subunit F [Shewanella sp. NKUCC05_KAH]|nr:potassium-transporting ATPase subunit F [Shewanella sp. DW31]MBS0041727.1 potassium-transporting ATPase subunit F [Shewanella sp. M16]MBW3513399.1 potassium-transporting ATPase subunit F [Shewanella sp. NKUCC01_JLK]MBW3525353.1 potassium-transporting ATPase subunit F [Shewanella sp. NKUCC05_KAH]MBW3530190.1 potassium-transporting ATPase subunit F [Shewanella sp. NKUCC06_TVS]
MNSRDFTRLIHIFVLLLTFLRTNYMDWIFLILSIALFIYLAVAMFAPNKF